MTILGLDHFNIRARDLKGMRDFFVDVIGLREGDRPNFAFAGHWLYAGDAGAVVHLVGADRERGYVTGHGEGDTAAGGPVDHLAFRGSDWPALKDRLDRHGADYRERMLPNGAAAQVFIAGPEGVTIEVVFPKA